MSTTMIAARAKVSGQRLRECSRVVAAGTGMATRGPGGGTVVGAGMGAVGASAAALTVAVASRAVGRVLSSSRSPCWMMATVMLSSPPRSRASRTRMSAATSGRSSPAMAAISPSSTCRVRPSEQSTSRSPGSMTISYRSIGGRFSEPML